MKPKLDMNKEGADQTIDQNLCKVMFLNKKVQLNLTEIKKNGEMMEDGSYQKIVNYLDQYNDRVKNGKVYLETEVTAHQHLYEALISSKFRGKLEGQAYLQKNLNWYLQLITKHQQQFCGFSKPNSEKQNNKRIRDNYRSQLPSYYAECNEHMRPKLRKNRKKYITNSIQGLKENSIVFPSIERPINSSISKQKSYIKACVMTDKISARLLQHETQNLREIREFKELISHQNQINRNRALLNESLTRSVHHSIYKQDIKSGKSLKRVHQAKKSRRNNMIESQFQNLTGESHEAWNIDGLLLLKFQKS